MKVRAAETQALARRTDQPSAASGAFAVRLRGRDWSLSVGNGLPIRVSVPLGANSQSAVNTERRKLSKLLGPGVRRPDIFVDLSTYASEPRLYEIIAAEFGGPIGCLPHYICFQGGILDDSVLMAEFKRALDAGVSHFTIHVTATLQLLELASKTRRLPTTSRGGGIVLKDLIQRQVEKNIFQRNLVQIIRLLKGSGAAISLGSTFRPMSCNQVLDEVHKQESYLQNHYAQLFLNNGIPVMREGLGHATPKGIRKYFNFLRRQDIEPPLMALGPVAIDHAGRYDIVAASAGVVSLGEYDQLGIVQSITRQEHSGGVPSIEAQLEGLANARITADIVNADRGYDARSRLIALHRESSESCVTPPGDSGLALRRSHEPGCSRCQSLCPLTGNGERELHPFIHVLHQRLPIELHEKTVALYTKLKGLEVGSIILFGSTAKDHFCYARVNGELRLQSDIEFNILSTSTMTSDQARKLTNLLSVYSLFVGENQPLFDIDVRVRLIGELSAISYARHFRRELFCYGITDGHDPEECLSTETDMISRAEAVSMLASALEWALLRLIHVSRMPANCQNWWIQAVRASLICKIGAVATTALGVPFTGTTRDIVALELGTNGYTERKIANLVQRAWSARLDRTGTQLMTSPFSLDDVAFALKFAQSTVTAADIADPPHWKLLKNSIDAIIGLEKPGEASQPSYEAAESLLAKFFQRRRNEPAIQVKYATHCGALT